MAESVSPVISVRSEMLCVSQLNGSDLGMIKENIEGQIITCERL